jgi:hypothetical protein
VKRVREFYFQLWPLKIDYLSTPVVTETSAPSGALSICPGCQVDLCEDCEQEIEDGLLDDLVSGFDENIDEDFPGWDDL